MPEGGKYHGKMTSPQHRAAECWWTGGPGNRVRRGCTEEGALEPGSEGDGEAMSR